MRNPPVRRDRRPALLSASRAAIAGLRARRRKAGGDAGAADAHLRHLADSVAGVLAYVDRDERIVFLSRGAEVLHGVRPEDHVGRTLREISKPSAYAYIEPYVRRVLSGAQVEYERVHPHPDGSVRTIHARLVPDLGADGVARGYFGLFTDVSREAEARRALDEANARSLRRNEALSRLTADLASAEGSVQVALALIAEVAATELDVGRASIWRMNQDRSEIVCEELYEKHGGRHSSGMRLHAADFPRYFAALAAQHVIDAADAHTDPRTSEFSSGYLSPLGIGAMLDAPVARQGRPAGVLCCEHLGGPRAWSAADRFFAIALANLAALAIETSERRRADSELRRIFDVIPVAIARWDGEQRYTFVNRKFADDRGMRADDVVGRSVREVLGDETYGTQAPILARASKGSVERFSRSLRQPGGKDRHYEVIVFGDRGDDGAVSGGYAVALDVTEQREVQEALAASERSHRSLLANVPGYAYRCANDRAWTLEFASDGVEALTGYAASAFVVDRSITFAELIHPDDRERVWSEAQAALGADAPFELEYRIRGRQGEEKWVWERGRGIRSVDGRILCIEGMVSDISSRRRAEDALRDQTRRLKLAQAASRMIVLDWDVDSDRLDFSDSPEWLRGPLPPDTGRYPPFKDQVHPEDREAFITARRRALETLKGQRPRFRFVRTDGQVLWIQSHQTVIASSTGRPMRVIAALYDVTGEVRATEALAELNRDLERRVAERTESLTKSEARLRDTREYLQALVDLMPDGVVVHDRGTIRYANREALRIAGATQESQVVGRNLLEFHEAENRAIVVARYDEASRRGSVPPHEFRLRRLDGTSIEVESSGTLIQDGESPRNLTVFRDITERRQRERALAQLAAIVETSNDAMVTRSPEGRILTWNRGAELLFGFTAAEAIGRDISIIAAPENQGDARRNTEFLREGLPVAPFEAVRLTKAGKPIDVQISVAPIRNAAGTLTVIAAIFRDVTERKRQDRELQESEERLRLVIDSVPYFVFAKDAQGRYLFSNSAYAAFYGKTPAEVVGMTGTQIGMSADAVAAVDAADAEVRRSGEMVRIPEHRMRSLAGEERVFLTLRMPLRYSEGAPDAVLVVSTDITSLKAAQAEIEALNADLEVRVASRTADLSMAHRELEAFSYSISHDLRAPVRAMSGFASMIIEDHAESLPEDVHRLLERIAAAGTRMGAMIDALLELARLSRSAVRRKPVDLSVLAREVWSEVIADEPHRAVVFSAAESCIADCDPVLMRNVLQNLLGNAFKYTRRTPVARVEFGEFGSGSERTFYVRDNGTGFDMAYAGKLFGTFQRLHGVNEFEGTGVGLATVRRIVERHGGRIWAEASPGEGASFQFQLGEQG